MIPIYIAAKIFAIAPIRIHQLIRNKQISFKTYITGEVYVNKDELKQFFAKNPDQQKAWEKAFKKTQKNLIANGYVRTFRNH